MTCFYRDLTRNLCCCIITTFKTSLMYAVCLCTPTLHSQQFRRTKKNCLGCSLSLGWPNGLRSTKTGVNPSLAVNSLAFTLDSRAADQPRGKRYPEAGAVGFRLRCKWPSQIKGRYVDGGLQHGARVQAHSVSKARSLWPERWITHVPLYRTRGQTKSSTKKESRRRTGDGR